MAAGTTECRASARELLPARFCASAGLGGGYWPACLAWSYSFLASPSSDVEWAMMAAAHTVASAQAALTPLSILSIRRCKA